MPRKTKTELEALLAYNESQFAEFRQKVVKTALAAGLRNGWCIELRKELKRLGLADLVPDGYMVQMRYTNNGSRGHWSQVSETVHRTARAAIAEARSEYGHLYGHLSYYDAFRLRKIDGNLRSTFTPLDSDLRPVKPKAAQRVPARSGV